MCRIIFLIILMSICALPKVARADWDDRPGFDFHPQTSDAAPCGVGTPRGHFSLEISPTSLPQGLTLTVKQDANHLCYVVGNIAEAPVIRVRQGADFMITLKNEITDPAAIAKILPNAQLDVPNDAVPNRPEFYDVLSGGRHAITGITNLHLHGFAVPPVPPQDDVIKICADPAVGSPICGRREITYHYHVPETMPSGLYWYHPHYHGEVQAQMLMGLSGAIVVEGKDDDKRRAAGIADRVFIIRQTQDLDAKPQSTPPSTPAAAPPDGSTPDRSQAAPRATGGEAIWRKIFSWGEGKQIDTAHELGCSSKTGTDEISLNGARVLDGPAQDQDLAPVLIGAGSVQLWRVLNAATDAFLDLALIDQEGKPVAIEVVARDGVPLADDAGNRLPLKPTVSSQLVPPAGRLEFMVAAPAVGRKVYFVTHGVDTGCAGDKVPERRLALVTALPTATALSSVAATFPPPAAQSEPDYFSGLLSRKTDRERVIALAEYPRPGQGDQTDFYIFERKPGAVLRPFDMEGPPLISTTAGSTEEWVIENWTNELHAFHIHQVHFRVLEVDGKAVQDPPLLDVVNVPYAKPSMLGTVRRRSLRVGSVLKCFSPKSLLATFRFTAISSIMRITA